jgi:hypothetical protein
MAKVICALLRYTDDEKSLIIEHEKLRQTVRKILFEDFRYNFIGFFLYLALVKYIKIMIIITIFILQFFIFISQGQT